MMDLVVIGDCASKRGLYMEKAAHQANVPIKFYSWDSYGKNWDIHSLENKAVKIDPPTYSFVKLQEMKAELDVYKHRLCQIGQARCQFLNTPSAILEMLDKRNLKKRLQERGVSVTKAFFGEYFKAEQVFEFLHKEHLSAVFIKPVYFSGAAGVMALRRNLRNGKMRLYTSCLYQSEGLINTKQIHMIEDELEIVRVIDAVLALDCIIERWHPKADFQGKSYDLRVVYQFNQVAHIVVRQAGGPITNLHLNNQARSVEELGLSKEVLEEIDALCKESVNCFEGLSMAGIDVLLEKGSLKPRIIEMNGQGDLIYQDIFNENKIYKEQVQRLCQG